ncbi:histidine kinase dimerization/phosphoacceptor domain -containing protein [Spirosoma panaciterrae]|uniref:histidine kinase dimerization/phosphoacceptor domain -containing protein n=1 Tax=Spirosoma panaciterrae TaxID=496058 RepID=UPI000371BE37|nr:histidine kinase dimerization/phosphoacceptor domain -containing protein [Spirosoma panaciterrae]
MNGYVVFGWLLLLLCLSAPDGQAQSTLLYFDEPPKETLGRNRNQLTINRFFTDRDDFLWFVTGSGLSRYDGHEIVTVRFDPADLNSLSSARVADMIQDERGTFWITTRDGGLNAYNQRTGNVAHFRHLPTNKTSLSSDKLRFLQRDESGYLWIGSDYGMNRFDPKTGRTIRFLPKPGESGQLQGNPLSPILIESAGHSRPGHARPGYIYVYTTAGFEQFDRTRNRWRCFPTVTKSGVPVINATDGLNVINGLCQDRRGLIWMGVPNQTGLRVFNPETGEINWFDRRTADGKPIPFPNVILEDRAGRLWLCCENDIFRISADRTVVEQCTAVAISNGEQLKEFVTLYEDRQGLIWLERASDKNPLFFDPRQERHPNIPLPKFTNTAGAAPARPGLARPVAEFLMPDPEGFIWISTDLGLIRYNPSRNEMKIVLKQLFTYFTCPLPGSNGASYDPYLLVGAEAGVFIYNKKTSHLTPVHLDKTGRNTIPNAIASALDKDGDLWISTWGKGLFHIPKGSLSVETGLVSTFEQWKNDPNNANSLLSNTLQKIAVDAQNTVWVCGAAHGLSRVNKRTRHVQRFVLRQGDPCGLASNYTYAPLIDKQGDVWVTSGYAAPLQKLSVKTGRFKKYDLTNGFTDDYFAHATLDGTGKIWFNQHQVVSCLDPLTERVTTFPQFVGNSVYSTPITTLATTGEIYFGCQNNLRRFGPTDTIHHIPKASSPLRLVGVSCFDTDGTQTMRPLPPDRWRSHELTLSHQENTLELKFALLDYRNTGSRAYAYSLAGPNDEPQWVSIGPKNTVDFAQMKPGTYLFHLKARNSDGIWTNLAPLRLHISPPWWQSGWAYAAYALGLLLGFWYLLTVRLREQARELALQEALVIKQQRDEIAQKNAQNELLLKEIHHRVKNNLSVVSGLLALQSAKVTDPNVLEAIQASQNRVQSMGIIHQKLYQGKQLGAIEMRDYFNNLGESILDSFDAAGRITIDCSMPELVLDIDTAVSIGLLTNELITNSLKYAFVGKDNGTIRISLMRMEDDSLLLMVADNGIGKQPVEAVNETGFGTQLVELLTRQLEGTLTYENQNGTLVKLRFNRPIIT